MASLGSLSGASKSRASLGIVGGLSGLAARIGFGAGGGGEEWEWGVGGKRGSKSKRKLVVSGVGVEDVKGYEAVRAWCEVG